MGALDFAGGTVVHVNAGVAALVAAIVRRQAQGLSRRSGLLPHNVPFTLLGAGLLWFGWFGFNAGSALAANGIAALAFTTTMLAPAGTLVVWTILDLIRQQKSTAVGAATAIVVGLVAITPAAGFVGPMSAIALGAIAAIPELLRAGDPRQDAAWTTRSTSSRRTASAERWARMLTGVFAQKGLNGVADGLLFGNPGQVWIQIVAVGAAIVYSGGMSFVLLKLIGLVLPLRADAADETAGLDVTQHGEEAYIHERGMTPTIDRFPSDRSQPVRVVFAGSPVSGFLSSLSGRRFGRTRGLLHSFRGALRGAATFNFSR